MLEKKRISLPGEEVPVMLLLLGGDIEWGRETYKDA